MKDFEAFVKRLLQALGLNDGIESFQLSSVEDDFVKVAKSLWVINEFLYVTTDEMEEDIISAYHRFWRNNHTRLLGIKIDDSKCAEVAKRLEHLFMTYGVKLRPSLGRDLSHSRTDCERSILHSCSRFHD